MKEARCLAVKSGAAPPSKSTVPGESLWGERPVCAYTLCTVVHLCSLGACTEKGWLEFGIYASRTPGTHLSFSFPTDSLMVSGQLAEQRCLPYFRA